MIINDILPFPSFTKVTNENCWSMLKAITYGTQVFAEISKLIGHSTFRPSYYKNNGEYSFYHWNKDELLNFHSQYIL